MKTLTQCLDALKRGNLIDYLQDLEHLRFRANLDPDYQPLAANGRRDLPISATADEWQRLDDLILRTRIEIAEAGVAHQMERGQVDRWFAHHLAQLQAEEATRLAARPLAARPELAA